MSETFQPQRYKQYYATVAYHRTDNLQEPFDEQGVRRMPENGERILVKTAWMMDKDDPYPGEFAFIIDEPKEYCHWIPQRDLTDFEEVAKPETTANEPAQ